MPNTEVDRLLQLAREIDAFITDLAGNKYTAADPRTKLIADGLKNGHTPFALPFGDLFNNPNGPWVATIRAALYGPDLNKALADGQSKIQAGLDAAN